MITQAVVGVLQFHSGHENVFLTALYYPTYWAIYHIVWGPDSALLKLQNQISLYSHIPSSLQVLFWRELLHMNVDKLRSLPAPFPWDQCEFHWKYIHPIKGTPQEEGWECIAPEVSIGCRTVDPHYGSWDRRLPYLSSNPTSSAFLPSHIGQLFKNCLIINLHICNINGGDNSAKFWELLKWDKMCIFARVLCVS